VYLLNAGNEDPEEVRTQVLEALRGHFRPEFLNRIDEIIVFQPLSKEQIGDIVEIQLQQVNERLADRQMHLEVTPAAKAWLADRGYDPAFGARPLKRVIQRELLDRLAKEVLSGGLRDGDTARVDAEGDDLIIRPVRELAEAAA
jgi:ATP-dependent Clp protease ATP-binding subunit ClpB